MSKQAMVTARREYLTAIKEPKKQGTTVQIHICIHSKYKHKATVKKQTSTDK